MWKILSFPVGFVLAFFVIGGFIGDIKATEKELRETYLGQTIEVQSPSLAQAFRFKVTNIRPSDCFPRIGQTTLYGTIIIDHPQGTKYLGVAHGSTAVNWQRDDGTGFTWFLDDLRLPFESVTPCHLYINITGVDVR